MCWVYRKVGICTLLLMLFLLIPNYSWGLNTHEIRRGETVTVAWDANTEPDVSYYEIEVVGIDRTDIISYTIQHPSHQAEIDRPKSGHYNIRVRACNTSDNCSTWTSSHIGGSPEPWNVYWKPWIPLHIFIIEDF